MNEIRNVPTATAAGLLYATRVKPTERAALIERLTKGVPDKWDSIALPPGVTIEKNGEAGLHARRAFLVALLLRLVGLEDEQAMADAKAVAGKSKNLGLARAVMIYSAGTGRTTRESYIDLAPILDELKGE